MADVYVKIENGNGGISSVNAMSISDDDKAIKLARDILRDAMGVVTISDLSKEKVETIKNQLENNKTYQVTDEEMEKEELRLKKYEGSKLPFPYNKCSQEELKKQLGVE